MQIQDLLSNPEYKQKIVLQKLISSYLNFSREDLRIKWNQEIQDSDLQKIITWYKLYVEEKKPLEYILWFVEFFNTKFIVNEATLIPRPETEYMITAVTEYCNSPKHWNIETLKSAYRTGKHWNVLLDIWTWCGVLWISVLLQNPDFFSQAIFTDYYFNALEVAKQNYEILITNPKFPVNFIQSDLLDFLYNYKLWILNSELILVANLPYIPEKTFDDNAPDNVQKWEPKPAFVWWEDWLIYYYKMLDQILQIQETRNDIKNKDDSSWVLNLWSLVMFLEMMTWQVDILRSKYSEFFIFEEVKTFHFNIRIVKVYFK